MSVAKRVAEEMGCRLGSEVGYTIRFEDCTRFICLFFWLFFLSLFKQNRRVNVSLDWCFPTENLEQDN